MITFTIAFGILTLVFFGLAIWASETTYESELKIICAIAVVLFFALTIIFTTVGCSLKTIEQLQTQAIELGLKPLTQEEIYNTSQADLDKLRNIGGIYFHAETKE